MGRIRGTRIGDEIMPWFANVSQKAIVVRRITEDKIDMEIIFVNVFELFIVLVAVNGVPNNAEMSQLTSGIDIP